MAKVTYTYWRHHRKYVEEVESLDHALTRAHYDEDNGDAAVQSITTERGVVIDSETIDRWWIARKQQERQGSQKERVRLMALRDEYARAITWKEASRIIRRMRWKPYISVSHGIAYLVANKWGSEQRIVSVKQLRSMTPAQFWQRLRHLDPYRVAEVERGTF
jgi:hypothetical protein